MKTLFGSIFVLILLAPLSTQAQDPVAEEVKSLDGIMAALYDAISGPAGQERDWQRMRTIFKKDAKFGVVRRNREGKESYTSFGIEDYIKRSGPYMLKNGFFEKEIGRVVEEYSTMIHVFSAYQTKMKADGEIMARGINSIQLVKEAGRYWITSIQWNQETQENPIPAKYLFKK